MRLGSRPFLLTRRRGGALRGMLRAARHEAGGRGGSCSMGGAATAGRERRDGGLVSSLRVRDYRDALRDYLRVI